MKSSLKVSRNGFIKYIGGINFKKIKKNKYIFTAKVQNFNLNSSGVSHGGYLCSILDSGMGSAAHDVIEKNKRCVTISLDVKFIGISKYKDILTGNVLIIKKTRSLVFVKADLLKSKNIIATASGIWKIL